MCVNASCNHDVLGGNIFVFPGMSCNCPPLGLCRRHPPGHPWRHGGGLPLGQVGFERAILRVGPLQKHLKGKAMSPASYELKAELRERVGKGSSRELRRKGLIPAVIYGDKQAPLAITLSSKEITQRIYAGGFMTTLATIDVNAEGLPAGSGSRLHAARRLPARFGPQQGHRPDSGPVHQRRKGSGHQDWRRAEHRSSRNRMPLPG
jgi:ribosomal protein L25 (general stress protein Ctc)